MDPSVPLAVGIVVALFALWWTVGMAMLAVGRFRLGGRTDVVRCVFLAPAVGLAVVQLAAFWLSRCGMPVGRFAIVLPVGFLLLALWSLRLTKRVGVSEGRIIHKRHLPSTRYLLMATGVLVGAFVLVAWPMCVYGTNWISYCNDDMAMYCLESQRRIGHGLYDVPAVRDMLAGQDYPGYLWFIYASHILVPGEWRSSSELLMATVGSATGQTIWRICMPATVALHLAVLCSWAALPIRSDRTGRRKRLAILAVGACFALITLGTIYQLIPQVNGLVLLPVACLLTYHIARPWRSWRDHWDIVPAALALSALLITYPEYLPFFILSLFILFGFRWFRTRNLRQFLPAIGVGAATIALLNVALPGVVNSMLWIARFGLSASGAADRASIFPFYLLPSGVANFWGWLPVGVQYPQSTTLGFGLLLGLLLFAIVVVRSAIMLLARRPEIWPALLVVMALLGLRLFLTSNDFGLYKLAMYIAPVMVVGVVDLCFSMKLVGVLLATVVSIGSAAGQWQYVKSSLGGLRAEIARATTDYYLARTETALAGTQGTVFADTMNVVNAKIIASVAHDRCPETGIKFLSMVLMIFGDSNKRAGQYRRGVALAPDSPSDFRLLPLAREIASQLDCGEMRTVNFATPCRLYVGMAFPHTGVDRILADRTSILNQPLCGPADMRAPVAMTAVKNHLVFHSSTLGTHYYCAPDTRTVSIHGTEQDPYRRGESFAAIGRHLVFELLRPSAHPVLIVSYSTTLLKGGGLELPCPRITAVGGTKVEAFAGGSGSLRLAIPIPVVQDEGRVFFDLDIGREPLQFHTSRTGVMSWWGKNIPVDPRFIAAFGREIRVVDQTDIDALMRPSKLSVFPNDLWHPGLFYSGLCEDGWVASRAWIELAGAGKLILEGSVPGIGDLRTGLRLGIHIDDGQPSVRDLPPGNFHVVVPGLTPGWHRIRLDSSTTAVLPDPDGRQVSLQLKRIAIRQGSAP